jgi:hypothetical protein
MKFSGGYVPKVIFIKAARQSALPEELAASTAAAREF